MYNENTYYYNKFKKTNSVYNIFLILIKANFKQEKMGQV